MGSRWGPEGPPQEAYSRVTNPQRFAPVIDAADLLVEDLVRTYDVECAPVVMEWAVRAARLTPRAGAPLTIGITDFPGVRLEFGHWGSCALPHCGCDACDEDADETIQALDELVRDVVEGRFAERLSSDPLRLWHSRGSRRGWSALTQEQYEGYAAVAAPGDHAWPAWPPRAQEPGHGSLRG